MDALLLALPVEGAVVEAGGGTAAGGVGGGGASTARAWRGARELPQQALIFTLDLPHLVVGEGEVPPVPAAAAPAGRTAGAGDHQHTVHPPPGAQRGWRAGAGRERARKNE